MTSKVVISVFIIGILCIRLFAGQSDPGSQNTDTLPWEKIVQKFDEKAFCKTTTDDEKTANFALVADGTKIIVPTVVKLDQQQTEAKLNLCIWRQGQWLELPASSVNIDPNGLIIDSNALKEGFYKLAIIYNEDQAAKENDFFAVISPDWKKDLLGWCQKNKGHIETNPDPQLIYSSIAVSHFDNVMELINKSKVLSENILSALEKVIKAKKDFEAGSCPDLVIGVNKIRLKRFEGASVAEFVIKPPENYDSGKKWPMFVYADPRRVGARNNNYYKNTSDVIVLWWHFPMPLGYQWKDYQAFLDIISDKLNIDRDKIYVNGECGNGIAAVDLGLKHPDHWAECSASLGNASRHIAGNALNMPLIFVKGGHNEDHLVGYYDFAVECFKYHGCRFFRHSKPLGTAKVRGGSVPTETRDLSPYRVFYTIESLAYPSAYWAQVDGREDENFIASIDSVVWGQSILVKTENVDAYTLNLDLAPLDFNRPVDIIENDKFLETVTGSVFTRKSPKYQTADYIKGPSLHGPVSDVFTDRYAVVWKGDENNKGLAKQLAGSGPCFEDSNLPADFIDTHNIVFVGRLNESSHFSQITGKLPVVIEDGKLKAKGSIYEGDFGTVFIYPNPVNSQKYLAVFSGTTDKATGLLNNAWRQIKSKENADIGIFQADENNKIQWLFCEKFSTVWDWHKSWDEPLVKLEKDHPKWKWRQWTASVLRKQLKADVMISEDAFNSSELPGIGELTLRDIAGMFRNDWIVKIRLRGSDLRELLMVPFNDISSRKISAPVIDGASVVKQPDDSDIICINELENDRFYTVAFPYKAVNGERMGVVMQNYRLEDEGFLVVLIKQYLEENKNLDLDAELDGMQLNIF